MIDRFRSVISRTGSGGKIALVVGSRSFSVNVATMAKLLVALAVVSAGVFAAGFALLGFGPQAGLAVDVTADDISITTNDGEISEVGLNPTLAVGWQGFDEPVEQLVVQVKISDSDPAGDENVLGGSQFLNCDVESHPDCGETAGNATFDYGDETINILNKSRYTFRNNDTLFNASDFNASDGETETTTVYVEVQVRADKSDGSSKFYTKRLSFDVSVTNEESTLSAEGTLNTSVAE